MIWKPITRFGLYEVSSSGLVRNIKTGRILRQNESKGGYRTVLLCSPNCTKRFLVHRLVATAFIPNPKGLPEVNHKDGIKENNTVDNLEWCTKSENQQHRRNILKKGLRKVQCTETGTVYESIKSAAEQNGTYIPDIVRACQKGSTAAGFHWTYTERKQE